jgi:hypothetical protein
MSASPEYLWAKPVGPVGGVLVLALLLLGSASTIYGLNRSFSQYESATPIVAQDTAVSPPTAGDSAEAAVSAEVRQASVPTQGSAAGCSGSRSDCESALFFIVLLAGALGGLLHSMRSAVQYIGNRELVWSWVPQYFTQPVTGAMLSVVMYLLVRAGFVGFANVSEVTPYGFAAAGALGGMFSQSVVEKLKAVAETMFTKPARAKDSLSTVAESDETTLDDDTTDNVPVPVVLSMEIRDGEDGKELVINGAGFRATTQVRLDGDLIPARFDGGRIVASLPLARLTATSAITLVNVAGDGNRLTEGRPVPVQVPEEGGSAR